MNFALLNFVLQAGRDSCALVCIAASKILVLVQNCVGFPADTGSKKKTNPVLFLFLGCCMPVLCASK